MNITRTISTERVIFPERSSCVRLKILLSKRRDAMARKRVRFQYFLNSSDMF